MSVAREAILIRIAAALQDIDASAQTGDESVRRDYRLRSELERDETVELFVRRVADYRATVARVRRADLQASIGQRLHRAGIRRLVAPADLPGDWLPDGFEVLRDDGLSPSQLDGCDGVLTACALGIAETGTIVLDGGLAQGRRAISLLPDYFLCVIDEDQIVGTVPEGIQRLHDTAIAGRPITFISGPSATSDIELTRVEGVHGPRTLEVIVVAGK